MKVVGDRILIDPIKEEQTEGFVVGHTNSAPPQKGKVIATGPGRGEDKMVLCAGDVVLYAKHAGTEIKVEGKTYIIMREGDAYLAL